MNPWTITIVRPGDSGGITDDHGDAVAGDPVRTDVAGVVLAPRFAGEVTDEGRQGVIIGWTAYPPPGTDLRATDTVEIGWETFVVDGEPGDWTNPFTGVAHGIEAALRRVEG